MACLGPVFIWLWQWYVQRKKLVDTPCHFNTGSRHGIIDQYQFFRRWQTFLHGKPLPGSCIFLVCGMIFGPWTRLPALRATTIDRRFWHTFLKGFGSCRRIYEQRLNVYRKLINLPKEQK